MYKHPIAFLHISNLTAARYAAAMMTDYIGFCLDQDKAAGITVAKAKEIKGWISGVKFIGEFYTRPVDEILAIALELELDAILLRGKYEEQELVDMPFKKITESIQPFAELHFDEEKISDKDGNIFAIIINTPLEGETGLIDFTDITEKLSTLEA